MKDAQKAGLVVNMIGCQCTMTLHSMGITLDKPKTVFDILESILGQRVIKLSVDLNSEVLSKDKDKHATVTCQNFV